MNVQVNFTENGSVDYLSLLRSVTFKRLKYQYQLRKKLISRSQFTDFCSTLEEEEEELVDRRRILVESFLFIDELDLLVLTTVLPKTTAIWLVGKPAKESISSSSIGFSEKKVILEQKVVAKCIGIEGCIAPTIFYCKESGMLVAGGRCPPPTSSSSPSSLLPPPLLPPKPAFSPFYTSLSKSNPTSIYLYRLAAISSSSLVHILPTFVIADAHFDSILDFCYLPQSQLLVSSSLDHTIKIWDPVACPFGLTSGSKEAFVRVKPGVYRCPQEEETRSNRAFGEVRRFYTGEMVCWKLGKWEGRRRKREEGWKEEGSRREGGWREEGNEILTCLWIGKKEMIGRGYKRPGVIKGLSLTRMSIEIEANQFDEMVPRRIREELEEEGRKRRKRIMTEFNKDLPNQLEKLKGKQALRKNGLEQIKKLLKEYSLMMNGGGEVEEVGRKVFEWMVQLGGGSMKIGEVFALMKRFEALHPASSSKEEFWGRVEEMGRKEGKKMFGGKKMEGLEEGVAEKIREGRIWWEDEGGRKEEGREGREEGWIGKDELKKRLNKMGIIFKEEEFEELLRKVRMEKKGKEEGGKVALNDLERYFQSSILERKLLLLSSPQKIIDKLRSLKKCEKRQLLFKLGQLDQFGDGRLTKQQFLLAMKGFLGTEKRNEAEGGLEARREEDVLFDALAEDFGGVQVISIGKLGSRILSKSDKLDLKYMYGLLGKVKANLIARGLSMDWLFKREEWIRKEKDLSSNMEESLKRRTKEGEGVSKEVKKKKQDERKREEVGEEEHSLGKEEFGRRVSEVLGGGEKEGRRMANFLAEGGEEVRMEVFLYYLRRVGVKEVFILDEEEEGRRVGEEVRKRKEEVERKWGAASKVEVRKIREILEKSGFENDIIDRILVKWVDLEGGEVDKAEFFKKMEEIVSTYKEERRREEEERKEEEVREEGGRGINLRELLTQEVVKTDRFLIRKFKFTEMLVNLIRARGRDEIGRVLAVCRRVAESERGGRMNLNSFLNVLKYNVSDIPDSLLQVLSNKTIYSFFIRNLEMNRKLMLLQILLNLRIFSMTT